jgi:hypothetical protein
MSNRKRYVGATRFEMVATRLKFALGIATDRELAMRLKMSQNAFANRKASGSIPYTHIFAVCEAAELDLNLIFAEGNSPQRAVFPCGQSPGRKK